MTSIQDVALEFQQRVAILEQSNNAAIIKAATDAENIYSARSQRVTSALNRVSVLAATLAQVTQDLGLALDDMIRAENEAARDFTKSIDGLHNIVAGATAKKAIAR